MRDAEVDVAVVGAGPAGAATARRLASRGLRVVLFERSNMNATRIGESLAPSVQAALHELGVWHHFLALTPLPSFGTRSVWGRAEPEAHSHLMSPWGCGWHVDRAAFDRMLADAAVEAGATLRLGSTVRRVQRSDDHWELRVESSGSPTSVRASVLVDATGRSASVARQLGAGVLRFDALVGVSCLGPALAPDERAHLLVEASSDGWWYAAPVPRGHSIVMLMTDADLCSRGGLHRAERLCAAADRAPALRARVGPSWVPRDPRVHRAHAQRLCRRDMGGGPPWLAVGDAALAVDPLTGSGVVRALAMARRAAECVITMVAGSGSKARHANATLAAYEEHCDEACTIHLVERAEHYAQEQRFDAAFWGRRHAAARALHESG